MASRPMATTKGPFAFYDDLANFAGVVQRSLLAPGELRAAQRSLERCKQRRPGLNCSKLSPDAAFEYVSRLFGGPSAGAASAGSGTDRADAKREL